MLTFSNTNYSCGWWDLFCSKYFVIYQNIREIKSSSWREHEHLKTTNVKLIVAKVIRNWPWTMRQVIEYTQQTTSWSSVVGFFCLVDVLTTLSCMFVSSFGYPDPDYLFRVQEELRLKGVTEDHWWMKTIRRRPSDRPNTVYWFKVLHFFSDLHHRHFCLLYFIALHEG